MLGLIAFLNQNFDYHRFTPKTFWQSKQDNRRNGGAYTKNNFSLIQCENLIVNKDNKVKRTIVFK